MYHLAILVLTALLHIQQSLGTGIAFPGDSANSDCLTKSNLPGKCVRIDKCPQALDQLRRRIIPKICGYERYFPIVCCPQKSGSIVDGVQAPPMSFQCGRREGTVGFSSSARFRRAALSPVPSSNGSPADSIQDPDFDKFLASLGPIPGFNDFPLPDKPGIIPGRPRPLPGKPGPLSVPDKIPDIFPIAGGFDAEPSDWPWMALLGRKSSASEDRTWFCSAVLLNTRWLLAAAHCFRDGLPDTVRLGEHDFSTATEFGFPPRHSDHLVNKVVAFPQYGVDGGIHSVYHDLALIELVDSVNFNRHQAPICLPWEASETQPQEGETLTITGWGAKHFGGEFSPILQEATVEVFSARRCNASYSVLGDTFSLKWPRGITADMYICAGKVEGGVDTCQGDSGGPVVQYKDGVHLMVGVVSQGYGCGLEEFPGLYVNLYRSEYLRWIREVAFRGA